MPITLETYDPITINANKMNIERARQLCAKKGLNAYLYTDTYRDEQTGEYRQRTFLKVYRNLLYGFTLRDWLPDVGIVDSRVNTVTPQFIEDAQTMLIIARACWEG